MNRIKDIVFRKESAFIAILFLVFFPVKTVANNSIYYVFDLVLNSGLISEIYTFNYTGSLFGCLEILKAEETLGSKAKLYYTIVFNFQFLLSLFSGLYLIRRQNKLQNFEHIDWVLLVIFSFLLFDALNYFTVDLPLLFEYLFQTTALLIELLKYLIIGFIAIYLFLKSFSKKVRIQVLLIALPMAIISSIQWFGYLGPYLLPIKII